MKLHVSCGSQLNRWNFQAGELSWSWDAILHVMTHVNPIASFRWAWNRDTLIRIRFGSRDACYHGDGRQGEQWSEQGGR